MEPVLEPKLGPHLKNQDSSHNKDVLELGTAAGLCSRCVSGDEASSCMSGLPALGWVCRLAQGLYPR